MNNSIDELYSSNQEFGDVFYSRAFIQQRIKEERFRTYRTGSFFSVVLFNPSKLVAADIRRKKKAVKKIAKFVDQETRETDIKGWWDRSTIAILLLDTSPDDASLLIEKLFARMQKIDIELVESIQETSYRVYGFPNAQFLEHNSTDEREEEDSKIPKQKSNQDFRKMYFSTIPLHDNPLIRCGFKKHQELIKRFFDIIVSIMGLIVLSPLFLLCALLIRLESRGPIFYRQTRAGMDGKPFAFLKFRSMYHDADEAIHKNHIRNLMNGRAGLSSAGSSGEKSYKLSDDARITRFGRFLRRTSIDELPQLINVIKGDMTLVGPRPHPIYEVEEYDLWHSHRLNLKPGITGLGQVYGRSNTEYENVYRLDVQYLKKNSLLLDLGLLFKTIPVVMLGRGAH